jgi:hypothetical protein
MRSMLIAHESLHAALVAYDERLASAAGRARCARCERQAIWTAISRKGCWHRLLASVQDPGHPNRDDNKWFENQGLVSVRQLWIKTHGYS